MTEARSPARLLWEAVERYHQLCYVAPEVRSAGTAAGLKGFWMNYFATRAAPMGAVGADVVEAVFFYFGPSRVRRAIPDAWSFSTPGAVLDARYEAMDLALRRELGPAIEGDAMGEAITLLEAGLADAAGIGKPLYAGWRAIETPAEPHLGLWHLCTVSREFRSGCHLIALAAAGLDGCEAIVSQVAVDEAPRAWIEDEAGWTADDTAAAVDRLIARGWLDEHGAVTDRGREGRRAIEALTDELDGQRWARLDDAEQVRLADLLAELVAGFPADDQLDWRDIYGENGPLRDPT